MWLLHIEYLSKNQLKSINRRIIFQQTAPSVNFSKKTSLSTRSGHTPFRKTRQVRQIEITFLNSFARSTLKLEEFPYYRKRSCINLQ